MHEMGVVHRDLKPENCVLDPNRTVKVIDFGLATRCEKGQLLDEYCGSPEYAAPEVMKQIPHEGPPIDIWSVGVILYDMVMGRLPFGGECLSSFDVLDIDEGFTPELQLLLKELLVEDPRKRGRGQEIVKCGWMGLAACVGDNSEMSLISTSESLSSTLSASTSLSDDSPLRQRVSREESWVVNEEMDFAEGQIGKVKSWLSKRFVK
jgi:serine/threonine protein kinase